MLRTFLTCHIRMVQVPFLPILSPFNDCKIENGTLTFLLASTVHSPHWNVLGDENGVL